jgi:hypothetical protein
MLKVIPEAQKVEIVENVVAAVKDITKLNKVGYDFINLASGFIAHYNLNGFKDYYEDYSLKDDILSNKNQNQWNNFHKGEENYDYYMSKKDVYNRIVAGIEYADLTSGNVNAFSFNQVDLFAGVDLDLS